MKRPEAQPEDVARLRAEVERLTEQGKQDMAILDGFRGDLARLTRERDGARRGCCGLAVELGEADTVREEAIASGWTDLYSEDDCEANP